MKDGIKLGLGITLGLFIGKMVKVIAGSAVITLVVNDEKMMNHYKETNPDLYEKLKKYQTEKGES